MMRSVSLAASRGVPRLMGAPLGRGLSSAASPPAGPQPTVGSIPASNTVARAALATAQSLGIDLTSSQPANPKTVILMMNMGGPASSAEVQPFLHNLFSDNDLIPLPAQKFLAPVIAKRRTPKVASHYDEIGGGSPIRTWTEAQAAAMVKHLDRLSPETAPHAAEVCFRYAPPLTEEALNRVEAYGPGVERVVCFSQYPQYSCSTSGSSFNELARQVRARAAGGADISAGPRYTAIDRWPLAPGLVEAFADNVIHSLTKQLSPSEAEQTFVLFSAHSLPMSIVERGDQYPTDVAATASAVMEHVRQSTGLALPWRVCWQSTVGPRRWLSPSTENSLKALGRQRRPVALVVPVAFTSDHIETLHELDLDYGPQAQSWGLQRIVRAESLNLHPRFTLGLAEIVANHLAATKDGRSDPAGALFTARCLGCTKESCQETRDFFAEQRSPCSEQK
ncbi:ferrochelatase [Fonticula alba]|uniref:Ferrochelatase n=1 Tax=Fonticula alba TaxID=691883 RepID=A0A058Z6D0_FONAL|nr:ferrochelatase [Fonticula alba]KCV69453.1 ferrochelatase [Fonticula alba]|eukprot:XP_009496018.1 ferrochelatase [Fonticula alba]